MAGNPEALQNGQKVHGYQVKIGNGPNTVSESMVSHTELSEFFGPHQVPGRELSEFLSAYIICVPKRTHQVFRRSHRVCRKTQ